MTKFRMPGRLSERLSRPPGSLERALDGATIIHTPSRPDHRYGNLLVLDDAPTSSADVLDALDQYSVLAGELGLPARACLSWETCDTDLTRSVDSATTAGLVVQLADVLIARPTGVCTATQDVQSVPEATWPHLETMASAGDDFTTGGLRRWFLEGRLELVRSGRAQIWGVLDEGNPVAACFSFTSGALSRVDQLLVRPDLRRRGLGSTVVAGIRDRLSDSELIVMEPETGNWRSLMYRRLGFEPAGITVTVIERGTSAG